MDDGQPAEPLVPRWLLHRFEAHYADPNQDKPGYEREYHGPINGLLVAMFPMQLSFMIMPSLMDSRMDRADYLVYSDIGHQQQDLEIPFLIYEVRPRDLTYEDATLRFTRYMEWELRRQEEAAPDATDYTVYGVLVSGEWSDVYVMRRDGFVGFTPRVRTTGEAMLNILQDLRRIHAVEP